MGGSAAQDLMGPGNYWELRIRIKRVAKQKLLWFGCGMEPMKRVAPEDRENRKT